jgi:hypothetical protein
MSLWNKSGKKPSDLSLVDKRNVIATKDGWVRRLVYTDVHGNKRQKDVTLVALGNLDKAVTMGNPDISQVYVANSTGGTSLKRNQLNHVYVVFTEAVSISTSPAPFRMTVANTAGGNNVIATSNTNKLSIANANNTLDFRFKVATAGTYKIQAQNISNTAATKVYSISGTGISETVNANISATVSNTNGTFTIV